MITCMFFQQNDYELASFCSRVFKLFEEEMRVPDDKDNGEDAQYRSQKGQIVMSYDTSE